MPFFASQINLTDPIGVFRASEPKEMQALIEAAIAAAPPGPRLIDAQLSAAGDGATFELVGVVTEDPNEVGVAPLVSTLLVRCVKDGTRPGLEKQINDAIATFPGGGTGALLKVCVAGAGSGATYMAVIFASTDASGNLGPGACPPLFGNLWVDAGSTALAPDGSECKPYPTIQQAYDFIAGAGSPPDFWTIHINAGLYFEDLTLPAGGKRITHEPIGLVIHIGNVTYTTPDPDSASFLFHGSIIYGALGLFTATGPVGAFLEIRFRGDDTFNSLLFAFDGTAFLGAVRLLFVNATIGPTNAPTAELVSVIGDIPGVSYIVNQLTTNSSEASPTTITVSTPDPTGFRNTRFASPCTFTGPAASFVADETSISTFFASGGVLAGAATIAYLDDDGGKAVLPFTVGTFANPQPVTLHEALQRIGNVVSVGQTVPIP